MKELILFVGYTYVAMFVYGFWVRMSMEDWNTDTRIAKIFIPIFAALFWPITLIVILT